MTGQIADLAAHAEEFYRLTKQIASSRLHYAPPRPLFPRL